MAGNTEQDLNVTTYRRLRDQIAQAYPRGRFVAIASGRVVADAGDVPGLRAALLAAGIDTTQALAVQAGIDFPEEVMILSIGPIA